jgi:hypothetical protein
MKGIVLALLLGLTVPLAVGAHDGHGSKAVMGTVKTASATAVEVETLDLDGTGPKVVRVIIDPATRFKVGKQLVEPAPKLVPGTRVVIATEWESLPDGSTKYEAREIRISEPKKPAKR